MRITAIALEADRGKVYAYAFFSAGKRKFHSFAQSSKKAHVASQALLTLRPVETHDELLRNESNDSLINESDKPANGRPDTRRDGEATS